MTDEFERRLRSSLHAADLPPVPDRLREFLVGVPRAQAPVVRAPWYRGLAGLAAAVAAIAIVIGALALGFSLQPAPATSPDPTASPGPSATAAPTTTAPALQTPIGSPLSEPADLLFDRPEATLHFERSVGPADRAVSSDATVERVEVDAEALTGSAFLAGACVGPGELTLEIRLPSLPGMDAPFPGLIVPCDGNRRSIEFTAPAGDSTWRVELEAVSVARGASWRLAVGEEPAETTEPAGFPPIQGTESWWLLWDVSPPPPGAGEDTSVRFKVPQPVTGMGVFVQCTGDTPATLTLMRLSESDREDETVTVDCPSLASDARSEFEVAGGEEIELRATVEGDGAVRLVVEGDQEPVATYPEAPALPAGIADTPYAVAGMQYLAVGTLGGNRQELINAPGSYPWPIAGGDFVAVNGNGLEGSTLYLASISDGELIASIVELPADRFIGASWIDPLHEQAFYVVGSRTGPDVRIERIGLDGSGQQVVATAPAGSGRVAFELALDYSAFVMDSCRSRLNCTRQVIDAETLETTTVTLDLEAEVCDVLAVTDGLVVVQTSTACDASGPQATMVTALDGSGARVLEGVGPGGGTTVRTSDGPVLVAGVVTAPPQGGYDAIDLRSGESRPLDIEVGSRRPWSHLRLPPDWLLLTPWHGLNDFPSDQLLKTGEVPLLVNIVTGETIEMVNLPH